MHIEELLDEIVETVEDGFNLKLFHRRIVDGEKIMDLSEEVRKSLPPEFESAKKITADRNRIIESAKSWANEKVSKAESDAETIVSNAKTNAADIVSQAQAASIVEEARLHAEQLISENNITKVANERAEALQRNTKEDCDILMNTTRVDCDKLAQQAKTWAQDIENGAYEYAMSIIGQVDNYLSNSTNDLRQTRQKLVDSKPIHNDEM